MRNHKQTNRRFHSEWYICQRCGDQYPRAQVIVQNGLIVCTERCVDDTGRDLMLRDLRIRREQAPPPLPEGEEA